MEPRSPDTYRMDQLVPSNTYPDESYPDEYPNDEMEQALLKSLEESWANNKASLDKWNKFQPLLSQVKRVGSYDKGVHLIYDPLSMLLYQYSYSMDLYVTIEVLDQIESQLKSVRIPDRELFTSVMGHLRSSL